MQQSVFLLSFSFPLLSPLFSLSFSSSVSFTISLSLRLTPSRFFLCFLLYSLFHLKKNFTENGYQKRNLNPHVHEEQTIYTVSPLHSLSDETLSIHLFLLVWQLRGLPLHLQSIMHPGHMASVHDLQPGSSCLATLGLRDHRFLLVLLLPHVVLLNKRWH